MDIGQLLPTILLLLGAGAAFFVSASAGLGGSLVLVPILSLALGSKEGISLASLLLASNNLVKLWVYRQFLPVRGALVIVGCTIVGAFVGARLLVAAPARVVDIAVVISFAAAFVAERRRIGPWRLSLAPGLALAAGATSGFSGTSGPLKGVAIRSFGLDRLHTVGAAAIVSAAADLTKTAVFLDAGLLGRHALQVALAALPLMIVATMAGRRFTEVIGEKGYAGLFWVVIGGYTVRLLLQAR